MSIQQFVLNCCPVIMCNIEADANETITKSSHITEVKIYLKSELKLEWWTMKEGKSVIFTGSHYPKRPITTKIYRIQRFTLSHDLTDRRSSIGAKHVTKSTTAKYEKLLKLVSSKSGNIKSSDDF